MQIQVMFSFCFCEFNESWSYVPFRFSLLLFFLFSSELLYFKIAHIHYYFFFP